MREMYRLLDSGASRCYPAPVRARRYYSSRFFVAGVALLALGTGNALIGSRKLIQYQAVVAEGRARGYLPDEETTNRILRPLDDAAERYKISRAKVDLYHVVLSGGLMMIALGAILTIAAWVRIRIRGGEALRLGHSAHQHTDRHTNR